jgi:hypothetical protein
MLMKNGRLYHCARCQSRSVICSHCDRGNIYCGSTCSRHARVLNHRIANQIYQKSLRGKQKHAARQHRYRQRKKIKVTDQGSTDLPPNDLLPDEPSECKSHQAESIFCHFCGEAVSPFLRHGYLHHHQNDQQRYSSSWPLGP